MTRPALLLRPWFLPWLAVLAGPLPLPPAAAGELPHPPVELNTADRADLEAIAGIGPETAAQLLRAREQAVFAGCADLGQRVRGAGRRRLARWSAAGLRVAGQDCAAPRAGINPEPAPEPAP